MIVAAVSLTITATFIGCFFLGLWLLERRDERKLARSDERELNEVSRVKPRPARRIVADPNPPTLELPIFPPWRDDRRELSRMAG
ncbi:hypothetical protein [Nocardia brasiliensis]|uniref:hypothetical protein n=1 Tax=Nocardia brasiliensis TaxID=37326 RepID=UPI0024573290|nr:hypothetical protein [Nocardia brasiliensis]